MTKEFIVFDSFDLSQKEKELDKAIEISERKSYQLYLFCRNDNNLSEAVRWYNWELMDNLLNIYDPSDVPAEKYIKILRKYEKALSLAKNPYSSIDIEMRLQENVNRIWKDMPWVAEKLPQEIEQFGLVYDYPSDFLREYDKLKDQEPTSLSEKQTVNLERTLWGSFYIYLDYFNNLEENKEFIKRPDFILDDYERICSDEEKFGKVIGSMHGSLRYVCYIDSDTLKSKIEILVKEALKKKQKFIDKIPKELDDLIDAQIMRIVESRSKALEDSVIYEIPSSYRDKNFLESIDKNLSENKLRDEKFWYWLFERVGYKIKYS